MWWPIMQQLRNYLKEQPCLTGVTVIVGSPGNKMDLKQVPLVTIIRDSEEGIDLYQTGEGYCTFYLDCWVRSDDKDLAKGYTEIYKLESNLMKALKPWAEILSDDINTDCWVEIKNRLGDADSFRPLVASRIILKVKWTKHGLL